MDSADNPLGWVHDAACFPDEDSPDGPIPLDHLFVDAGHSISNEAWETCVSCPVRAECLTWAYQGPIRFGYFGGVSPTVRDRYDLDELLAAIRDGRLDRTGRIRRPR